MAAPDFTIGEVVRGIRFLSNLATLIDRVVQTRKSFIDAGQVCHPYSRMDGCGARDVRDLRDLARMGAWVGNERLPYRPSPTEDREHRYMPVRNYHRQVLPMEAI